MSLSRVRTISRSRARSIAKRRNRASSRARSRSSSRGTNHEPGQFRAAHTHLFFWVIYLEELLFQIFWGRGQSERERERERARKRVPCFLPRGRRNRNKRILKWSFDMNYAPLLQLQIPHHNSRTLYIFLSLCLSLSLLLTLLCLLCQLPFA